MFHEYLILAVRESFNGALRRTNKANRERGEIIIKINARGIGIIDQVLSDLFGTVWG